jgi:hypothetical protein
MAAPLIFCNRQHLLDALGCALQVADVIGVRALAVHAKDEQPPRSTNTSASQRPQRTRGTYS